MDSSFIKKYNHLHQTENMSSCAVEEHHHKSVSFYSCFALFMALMLILSSYCFLMPYMITPLTFSALEHINMVFAIQDLSLATMFIAASYFIGLR